MTSSATTSAATSAASATTKTSNFLRQLIERDLGDGSVSRVVTRFPPEPNGYLHIGHAKSICLNFGLARDYGGVCHLRFDDTNPEKESQEYVDAIIDAVRWLGFDWTETTSAGHQSHLYLASDYFGTMHRAAVLLIEAGLAYVDEQSADEMRANRGDFGKAGVDSPYRSRTVAENLARFAEMRDGKLADGSAVLRAKIDMAHANINMRDPALYRIRRAHHHNTGDAWCIYPMYTFAHPIEDAIEGISHSICTLEFEDQRPFYDWLLARLAEAGLFKNPLPHQYEFARLNLSYVVTSKRKLAQLVNDKHVSGWDDPRMPTLVGLRRRGYTARALQLFCERIGVTKTDSWIDYSTLEGCLRETLDATAPRAMAVLDPIKLTITNFPAGHVEPCSAPVHPHHEELGRREFGFSKELWIDASDFQAAPEKGYHRLYVGNKVRLKYGYVVECTGYKTDAAGKVTEVEATYYADSKSGSATSGNYKVKGVMTWVSAHDAVDAEVRMYDRLFLDEQPDAGGKDFLASINPNSLKVVTAKVEPSLAASTADQKFQFERHGYFCADLVDHAAGGLVFNYSVGLKDSFGK
ncbi:MAG: glutamine--tRNA ligase/YqeY domain fusion protein [Cytophagales bacterium]|nr:glutamine--tRNA ligase/YqeY domain fusion protein [Cytophagales bacterium]